MDWKLIDKGASRLMILLPGWGFTWHIFFKPGSFTTLDLNFLVPQSPVTRETAGCLSELVHGLASRGIAVSVLGWSLGALAALQAFKECEIGIERLILVAARRRYTREEIEKESGLVEDDPAKALSSFYRRCFVGQRPDFDWFKKNVMMRGLKAHTKEQLLEGLEYLLEPMDDQGLKSDNVTMVYGAKDIIVTREYRIAPKRSSTIVVPDAGHLPFLSSHFTNFLAKSA